MPPDDPGPTLTRLTEHDPAAEITVGPVSAPSSHAFLLPAGQSWPVGFILLEDFEVEGILGQGGMGVVYRVHQRATGRPLAVKRARLSHPDARRRFLAELQFWLDLPAHPNLAPCRFFRTILDEVVIFTDLAEGGSLAGWIEQHRLTRVVDILDVAIQVARGLHALHETGLVHQDVKPANVLMTPDGIASVTDFGLARARARIAPTGTEAGASILVSSGAMTPAYCSPEQLQRRPVSRRTDIWSWGVLVLEMFVGKVPCCELGGPSAAAVLARHRAAWQASHPVEAMPDAIAEILDLCFHRDPSQRWSSLADAAELLVDLYRELAGTEYPRPALPLRKRGGVDLLPASRSAAWSGHWEPARKWLALAYEAAGRDPTEVEADLPAPAATRKAQAVADLAVYEEARVLLEQLFGQGQMDLEQRLAGLLVQKALLHGSVGDWPQALDLFERSIATWQRLVYQGRKHELTPGLVRTLLHRAEALRHRGDQKGAIALCDRVVTLWQKLDNRRARRELRSDLAGAYLEKGLALRAMGKARQALAWFTRALEVWQREVDEESCQGPANDLAQAYLCKASVLSSLGQADEALGLCERAITIRRRLVQREGRRDLRGDLGRAYLHKANVLRSADASGAVPLYDLACSLLERCVHEEGRDDLAQELARAYMARASVERSRGEPRLAARISAQAASIWESLVDQEGRREWTHDLARAYLQEAHSLRLAGEFVKAFERCDRAIGLWQRLVQHEGRADLTNDLARSYVGKANILRDLKRSTEALELVDRAIELRRFLLAQTGRDDIPADLARDRIHRGEILIELGQSSEGRTEIGDAVTFLQALVSEAPRSDLRSLLLRARRTLDRPEGHGAGRS